MTDRITNANLKSLCDTLNNRTGNPRTYCQSADRYTANVGHYHVSHAYGGVALCQVVSKSGGVTDVLYSGYVTERDLWNRMHALLRGFELGASAAR